MSVFFDVAGVDGALRRKSRLRGEVTAVGRHGAAQRRRANVRQLLVVGDSSLFAVQLVVHLLPVRHDAHDCRNLPQQPTITRIHTKQHRATSPSVHERSRQRGLLWKNQLQTILVNANRDF